MQPFFPGGANLYVVFGVFAFFLVLFDLTLVRWFKLSSSWWKIVDYIWLGFAALGLFSTAAQVRKLAATDQINMFQQRAAVGLSALRDVATILKARPGPVCRTFIRSQNSPPQEEMERAQQAYNQACEWFERLGSIIPREVPMPPKLISADSLPSRPDDSIGDLKAIIDSFYDQLEYYNQDVEQLLAVYNATRSTDFEDQLIYLGPFLLALALALRITKVTGEIRLARPSVKQQTSEPRPSV
jgi:hypothetical protein